ncbi:hypothetical protein AVEN_109571-1 [Araneus ventricosus]|uniref:Uncharacterized protein n=1 Tax=Araneus ventricosus TaxID=182803 RepID=A0A4Y2IJE2_ARAVE|nr:hypothetical protein AVEN_109571-1 [Araneus ventricosus]
MRSRKHSRLIEFFKDALATKYRWAMKSLRVSSTTKTRNDEDPSDNEHVEKGFSIVEAYHCVETAMKWFEQQKECNSLQLMYY